MMVFYIYNIIWVYIYIYVCVDDKKEMNREERVSERERENGPREKERNER